LFFSLKPKSFGKGTAETSKDNPFVVVSEGRESPEAFKHHPTGRKVTPNFPRHPELASQNSKDVSMDFPLHLKDEK
jgi:hypothetical protein